jgi:ribosomal protein L24E
MKQNRCAYCGDKIPKHLGIHLGGKLYCCQRHAEKSFIGYSYYEL